MITPEPPRVTPRGRYCQAQAARALGMSRRHIYDAIFNYKAEPIVSKPWRRLRVIDPLSKRLLISGAEIMRYWKEYYD